MNLKIRGIILLEAEDEKRDNVLTFFIGVKRSSCFQRAALCYPMTEKQL